MNTINKIMLVQIAMVIGGLILYTIMDYKFSVVLINHILLTIGYLCGLWHSKN